MKGMTNNQIIMNEAAKLDPATLHAIATAHHTPEQIAAMAANAVTTDENGDEQPATIADVEIILAAAELHTFDYWKKEGKSVKKGETHLIECYLWKYTTRPSKAQREAAEAEGKEAAPAPHFYPTKSHLFLPHEIAPVQLLAGTRRKAGHRRPLRICRRHHGV
jgi:hypothetical protein